MKQYLQLLTDMIDHGVDKSDRTGVGARSLFGYKIEHNLSDGFPLITTKKMSKKVVVHDLLWMLSGSTNIKYLNDNDVHIWDAWADDKGDVGPVYGRQWRAWPDGKGGIIDQVEWLVNEIVNNPNSRRLIISAWNVADLEKMSIPPCPTLFQFNVTGGYLSCHLYQRSADAFVGLPFNIAGFSLLAEMIAKITNLKPGKFIHSFGDLHLYQPHVKLAHLQLSRKPKKLPTLHLSDAVKTLSDFTYDAITINHYQAHPHIKADVAI